MTNHAEVHETNHLGQDLQTTAIYWENWQTPFRGVFGGLYGGKWSWKLVDDFTRNLLGTSVDQKSKEALTFNEPSTTESLFARQYYSISDFHDFVASKKINRFSFFPVGTKTF